MTNDLCSLDALCSILSANADTSLIKLISWWQTHLFLVVASISCTFQMDVGQMKRWRSLFFWEILPAQTCCCLWWYSSFLGIYFSVFRVRTLGERLGVSNWYSFFQVFPSLGREFGSQGQKVTQPGGCANIWKNLILKKCIYCGMHLVATHHLWRIQFPPELRRGTYNGTKQTTDQIIES